MSSEVFKELSNTYSGWSKDLDKLQDFLSTRAVGDYLKPVDLANRLNLSISQTEKIFSILTECGHLVEEQLPICSKLSCQENPLAKLDDGSAECDLCDELYATEAVDQKSHFRLTHIPKRTFKKGEKPMFAEFNTDLVDLIKKDGTNIPKIPASVQKNRIFIDDASLVIEDGDQLEHKLANGLCERYMVLDHGFKPAFSSMPAHYQVAVKKVGSQDQRPPTLIQHITLNGENGRVNNHTVDQSVNTVIKDSNHLYDQMKALTKDLETSLSNQVQSKIEELRGAKEKGTFLKKYKEIFELTSQHIGFITKLMPLIESAQKLLG